MFTVCSKCNLRLTVTAMDLRAAQGYVRCGRCQNVFNALAALGDDPARTGEHAALSDTQSRAALKPQPERPAEPKTPEDVAVESHIKTDTALEFNPASTNINELFIEPSRAEDTGNFESIVLKAEDTPLADEAVAAAAPPQPEPLPDSAAAPGEGAAATPAQAFTTMWADPARAAAQFTVTESAAQEIANALSQPVHSTEAPAPSASEPTPELEFLRPRREPAPESRGPVMLLAVVLALCLLGQIVHHFRLQLATTALSGPLTALYAALGIPLGKDWDIANYEIRQLGASTEGAAAGDLLVRASIANRDSREQPLPLLRVVMQDRFGNRVAGRDLNPEEYLGAARPPSGLMAPGQRVDVQVALKDPGQSATGFELDVCMRDADRSVTCANDGGAH